MALKLSKNTLLPKSFVLRQLEGLQKSKYKLPVLYTANGIIFPPKLNLEQSSSEITAVYKSQIVKGKIVIDLTGGFGIDCLFFSKNFSQVVYIERSEELFNIVKWNFKKLGVYNIELRNENSIQYLNEIILPFASKDTVIYVDPARRDNHNKKVFLFSDCEPDVLKIMPQLLEKASHILIKTSPMLDLDLSLKQLTCVSEIHIVAVDNECKEVLYLIKKGFLEEPVIKTINFLNENIQVFNFSKTNEEQAIVSYSQPLEYLYEPNVAVLKGGAFRYVSSEYDLYKLGPNTHLYTSAMLANEFPGKIFKIHGTYKFKDNKVFTILTDRKVNVVARNFPYSVEEIKREMKLKDGGDLFLFAIRNLDDKPLMILASKLLVNTKLLL